MEANVSTAWHVNPTRPQASFSRLKMPTLLPRSAPRALRGQSERASHIVAPPFPCHARVTLRP